jgi:hypothetical protein
MKIKRLLLMKLMMMTTRMTLMNFLPLEDVWPTPYRILVFVSLPPALLAGLTTLLVGRSKERKKSYYMSSSSAPA